MGERGGLVDGAFIHTPPYPAQLSALPRAAVAPPADLLAGSERRLDGVGGAQRLAEALAAAWCKRRDEVAELALRLRLYRLAALHPPEPAPPRHADSPTSNALYQRLGFEPVEDRTTLRFKPLPQPLTP